MIILNSKLKTYKVKNNKHIFEKVSLGSNLSTFASNSKTNLKIVGLNQRKLKIRRMYKTNSLSNVIKSNNNYKSLNQVIKFYKKKSPEFGAKRPSNYNRLVTKYNRSQIGAISAGARLLPRRASDNFKKVLPFRSLFKKFNKSENFLSEMYNFNLKFLNYNYCKFMVNNLIVLINSLSSVHNKREKGLLSGFVTRGEETSNVLYFKNNGLKNNVYIEENSLNSSLTLVVKFLNSSDESSNLSKSEQLKASTLNIAPLTNTYPQLPFDEENNKDHNLEEEGTESAIGEDELLISKFKYNKSLFNILNPFNSHVSLDSKEGERDVTAYANPFLNSQIKRKGENDFNHINTLILYKKNNKNKNLFYNSYYYKKYMVNFFASMPHILRILWAIKLARKLNAGIGPNKKGADQAIYHTTSGRLRNLNGSLIKKTNHKNLVQRTLNSKLYLKSIEKFLGVDINNYKVLKISISNLNLGLRSIKWEGESKNNLNNKISHAYFEKSKQIYKNRRKDYFNLETACQIKGNNTVGQIEALTHEVASNKAGLRTQKNLNMPVLFTNNIKNNGLDIQDNYIVNNLLMQKLILSKYRSTELRSNLLKIRLSNLGFALTAPYSKKENEKNKIKTDNNISKDLNTVRRKLTYSSKSLLHGTNKKAIIKLVRTARLGSKKNVSFKRHKSEQGLNYNTQHRPNVVKTVVATRVNYGAFDGGKIQNFNRSAHNAVERKGNLPFLTLSNRLPILSVKDDGTLGSSEIEEINKNKTLYLYGNIYKVFEIKANNRKFRLYPHIFGTNLKRIHAIGDRFNFFSGIFKNSTSRDISHDFTMKESFKRESLHNKEIVNSTINYWLLEQEKLNKRSFMYPHLSMQINGRASSSQHQINFLKVNQLGFMYSNGGVNKTFIINQFLDKVLQFDNFMLFKHKNIFFNNNKFLKFNMEYSKKHKKSYRKKHFHSDYLNFSKRSRKSHVFSIMHKEIVNKFNNFNHAKFIKELNNIKALFKTSNRRGLNPYTVDNYYIFEKLTRELNEFNILFSENSTYVPSFDEFNRIKNSLWNLINFYDIWTNTIAFKKYAKNNIRPQYVKLNIKFRFLKLKFSKIKKKYKNWLISNKKLRRKNYLNMHLWWQGEGSALSNRSKKAIFILLYVFLMDKKLAMINFKNYFLFKYLIEKKTEMKKSLYLIYQFYDSKLFKPLRRLINKYLIFSRKTNSYIDTKKKKLKLDKKEKKIIEKLKKRGITFFNFKEAELMDEIYGKKVLRALRIRGKKKKRYEFILYSIKEKIFLHLKKFRIKSFIYWKWRRILGGFSDKTISLENKVRVDQDMLMDFNNKLRNFQINKTSLLFSMPNMLCSLIVLNKKIGQWIKVQKKLKKYKIGYKLHKDNNAWISLFKLWPEIMKEDYRHSGVKNSSGGVNKIIPSGGDFKFSDARTLIEAHKYKTAHQNNLAFSQVRGASIRRTNLWKGTQRTAAKIERNFVGLDTQGSVRAFRNVNMLSFEAIDTLNNLRTRFIKLFKNLTPVISNSTLLDKNINLGLAETLAVVDVYKNSRGTAKLNSLQRNNLNFKTMVQNKQNFISDYNLYKLALAYLGRYLPLYRNIPYNYLSSASLLQGPYANTGKVLKAVNYNNKLWNETYPAAAQNKHIHARAMNEKNKDVNISSVSPDTKDWLFKLIRRTSSCYKYDRSCVVSGFNQKWNNKYFLKSILNQNYVHQGFNFKFISLIKRYNYFMFDVKTKKNIIAKFERTNNIIALRGPLFRLNPVNNVNLIDKTVKDINYLVIPHPNKIRKGIKYFNNKKKIMNNVMPFLFKSLESNFGSSLRADGRTLNNNLRFNPNDSRPAPVSAELGSNPAITSLVSPVQVNKRVTQPAVDSLLSITAKGTTENNLELSGALSPFFDFSIDNKNISNLNKLGLDKILSEFKFFRFFKNYGADSGNKQVISYSFTKNINRTNTLTSLDHTGSLLKNSVSVILKYFFKLMGFSLISKPIFIFSNNKVNIQISYFMFNNFYFSNANTRSWNETVSTLSSGMAIYWPLTFNDYNYWPKLDMPETGNWPSYWKLKNYPSKKKPFNDKIIPYYPGNVPYLSQNWYKLSVMGTVNKMWKINSGKSKSRIEDYYEPYVTNTLSFFYDELNSLSYILERFYNCPIKLELNKLDIPYSDTNILAQLIGISGEEYKFEKIKRNFIYKFKYYNPNREELRIGKKKDKNIKIIYEDSDITIPSGYKVRVAGRFYKHRIIPRRTVSSFQKGSMARRVVDLVEKARYVNKSKRGSFAITVWISHIF